MKNIATLLFFLLCSVIIKAQTSYYIPTGGSVYTSSSSFDPWYKNLQKYWYYRYKLVNDFMLIGPDAGMSTPAYRRNLGDNLVNGPFDNCLDFSSDATIDLGHYIGMLALEHQQLANNGFNTARTDMELRYAQNALKRLTNNAAYYEAGLSTGYGGLSYYPGIGISNPTLITGEMTSNAMFLRDDFPYLTFVDPTYSPQNWKHFNRTGLAPAADPTIPWTIAATDKREVRTGSGAFYDRYFGPDPRGGTHLPATHGSGWNVPNCESQDQLQVVIDGLALSSMYAPADIKADANEDIFKLIHYTNHFPIGCKLPFWSIPDALDNCECAKHDCSTSGIFFISSPPATKLENDFIPSPITTADMLLAGEPATLLGGFGSYALIFEYSQYMSTNCTYGIPWLPLKTVAGITYFQDAVTYVDGYVAFANDWTVFIPPFPAPGFVSPAIAAYNAAAEIADWTTFLTGYLPGGGPFNTSWISLVHHADGDVFGTPQYPLMYELAHGAPSGGWSENYKVEGLLNEAPPCGPYNYEANKDNVTAYGPDGDFYNYSGTAYPTTPGSWEWSGNDRLDDPYHRQGNSCFQNLHFNHEYNGLDYMFLFDLYAMTRGTSYLQGMMNPYYCEKYDVDYPVPATGIGSNTKKLKLNWLEYISAINSVHTSGTGGSGWLDYRAAKVIDLKPSPGAGFHAEQGSFFLAHIKDYSCNGGENLDQPYTFAELNPSSLKPIRNDSTDTTKTYAGFHPFEYIPNGKNYVPQRLPPTNPADHIMDTLMTPEFINLYTQYLKYVIINTVTDSNILAAAMQEFHWTDDTIARYKIPLSDTVTMEIMPNPTASASTLSYSISRRSSIALKLTNMIGNDFSNLIDHYETDEKAGKYNLPIHSEQLTPGLYIITLKVGPQTYSRKLSVIN